LIDAASASNSAYDRFDVDVDDDDDVTVCEVCRVCATFDGAFRFESVAPVAMATTTHNANNEKENILCLESHSL
jgi:hypothetical protein